MTSPMQVLEDVHKVWIVWHIPPMEGGEIDVVSIHRTKSGAEAFVSGKPEGYKKYLSIDWEVLHD